MSEFIHLGINASLLNENEQLKAENAKLRQMVQDYKQCSVHTDCAGCKYDGKPSEHCPYSSCFSNANELCKLGIEVGE